MTKDEAAAREEMVERQIVARGVVDPRVLKAMGKIPRHLFVHANLRDSAYLDEPLPIGSRQTISQPFIVAYMTEALALKESDKVLEIGTGSGYQTAVLAEIASEIRTVEIIPELAAAARDVLSALGYDNIRFKTGDGSAGWPEEAPFDAIIVTAAPAEVPAALTAQLREGGRMIIPVGRNDQALKLVRRTGGRVDEQNLLSVRFVPLLIPEAGGLMRKFIAVVAIGAAVAAFLHCAPQGRDNFLKIYFPDGRTVTAELAITDAERARGLMFREKIAVDQGMLFCFTEEDLHAFWMKNTLIPLDMIWLDKDRRIVHIWRNVPPCKEDPCPSYAPDRPGNYVLELGAGGADYYKLKLFDRLEFTPPVLIK